MIQFLEQCSLSVWRWKKSVHRHVLKVDADLLLRFIKSWTYPKIHTQFIWQVTNLDIYRICSIFRRAVRAKTLKTVERLALCRGSIADPESFSAGEASTFSKIRLQSKAAITFYASGSSLSKSATYLVKKALILEKFGNTVISGN